MHALGPSLTPYIHDAPTFSPLGWNTVQARLHERVARGLAKTDKKGNYTDAETRQILIHMLQLNKPLKADEEEQQASRQAGWGVAVLPIILWLGLIGLLLSLYASVCPVPRPGDPTLPALKPTLRMLRYFPQALEEREKQYLRVALHNFVRCLAAGGAYDLRVRGAHTGRTAGWRRCAALCMMRFV